MNSFDCRRALHFPRTLFCQRSRCLHSGISPGVAQKAGRGLQVPLRKRWKDFWIPQADINKQDEGFVDATQLLVRAGYLRQAYSGIYHMLPLGLRVQEKLERLIDKHMQSLGASKTSLSSISSQRLWQQTGRLQGGTEFFKFTDRKNSQWLLTPTHEEEITSLVKESIFAPNHLPLRLYQISRKYRDEKRPRGGLLRGREFIMKDLYTFDKTEDEARATYELVRKAYSNFFDELKVRYIEARADSGNMGGNLSHEYHFPSSLGEDDVINCTTCDYARNEEWVPKFEVTEQKVQLEDVGEHQRSEGTSSFDSELFISKDGACLVKAFAIQAGRESLTKSANVNPFAVKACLDGLVEIDTGIETPLERFHQSLSRETDDGASKKPAARVVYLFDQLASDHDALLQVHRERDWLEANELSATIVRIKDSQASQSHLHKRAEGDPCPECQSAGRSGSLSVTKAIEAGHTFHLGSRYSSKLDLMVPGTATGNKAGLPVSMGCHGIGVSRLMASVASSLLDDRGLNWPRAIAPFEVAILVDGKQKQNGLQTQPEYTSRDGEPVTSVEAAHQVYDSLAFDPNAAVDVLLDDREGVNFGWKLKDADLVGYPVIVVVGKSFVKNKNVEIQCRRLKVKEDLPIDSVPQRVRALLEQL